MKQYLITTIITIAILSRTAWSATISSVDITTGIGNFSQWSLTGTDLGTAPNNGEINAYHSPYSNGATNPSPLGIKTGWDNREFVSGVSTSIPTGHGFTGTVNSVLKRDWVLCDTSFNYSGVVGITPPTSGDPFYVSYHKWNADRTTNDKLLRYDCSGAVGNCNDIVNAYSGSDSGEVCLAENDGLESWSGRYLSGGGAPEGSWYKEEYEFQPGTEHPPVESGDSYFKKLRNNVTIFNRTTMPIGDKADLDILHIEEVHVAACPVNTAATYWLNVKYFFHFYQVFITSANANGTCTAITDATKKSAQLVSSWSDTAISGILDLEDIDTANGLCFTVRDGTRSGFSSPVLATVGEGGGGGETPAAPGPSGIRGSFRLRGGMLKSEIPHSKTAQWGGRS